MKTPKFVNAGVGERMQYLAHEYNDTTIRFILHYPGALNPDTLCAATAAIVGSVDVLHASFMADSMKVRWHIREDYEPADFFTLAECDGDPMKPARSFSLRPIEHEGRCQFHVTYVQGSESCAIVVRMSHLVVDGSDGKYLLNKLAESYRMIDGAGNTDHLEIKDGNRSAMNAYRDLSPRELFSLSKMPFNGARTDFPFADVNAHGPLRLLRVTIPAEVLENARKKAKARGATVNDLLLAACFRSYAKITGRSQAMSISGMMDLRQHCKDGTSEGLTNMSGGLNTILENGVTGSFTDTLQDVADQTRQAKADPQAGLNGLPMIHGATKAVPMRLLLKAADIIYSSMSLNLTNLGNIPGEPLAMGGAKPMEGIFGGPLKRKPSVQVGAASFDGTMELTILGDFVTKDLVSLSAFLNGIRTEIEEYAEEA